MQPNPFADTPALTAAHPLSRTPDEWRVLPEQYQALGFGMCASICIAKIRQLEKREAQLRKDTLVDMFPDGMDDGFIGVESGD